MPNTNNKILQEARAWAGEMESEAERTRAGEEWGWVLRGLEAW